MNKPPLVMADEPTSALDDKNAAEVIRLLEEQSAAFESALIIVTHDQRLKDHFPGNIVL
jgi:putative ABC transport system ATP-binding protein